MIDLIRLANAIRQLCLRDEDDGPISSKGRVQRWLIDLRPLLLRRDCLAKLAAVFWELHRDLGPFQIGTTESAGIPLLTAILMSAPPEHAKISGFIVRKQRKTTGMCQTIEGAVTNAPIVLVDDILNSSSSAEKARVALAAMGARSLACLSSSTSDRQPRSNGEGETASTSDRCSPSQISI